ncbi:ABC transporter substrate-binding protein [Streptomyces sp. APSN-46.1]|uniref:ABC transporter substrate-binding protein n=1 Tax=Streptomyces sp. APSN-46.1 TaxID=2929049 RepID=UPI001FB1CB75|nr:ABC transporter substrate-binding protein [Streptomyces sp. APSN-46.1]MCJ1676070.1 ABC transporter substrate-binding protein [Streptomyces sp. APSN-46.1]
MHSHTRPGRSRAAATLSALALLATVTVAGCGNADDGGKGAGGAGGDGRGGGAPLTVGLTYVPNIQFAPFYVAESLHYYEEAGLNVKLRHHSFTDAQFGALAAGQEDVVYAGGDEMLQARSQKVPVVNVATLYRKYPVAVMVRSDSPVKEAADLKGRTIGTPGPYGETYFALLALLKSANLSTSDVKIQNIGFTQQAALTGGKVDAVTGYLNNDAVQFAQSGTDVRTIQPAGSAPSLPLVAAGLGASQKTVDGRSADLKAFIAATLKGLQYTIDHPKEAVELSKKTVPGLEDPKKQADALAVLNASLPLMKTEGAAKPGQNDAAQWKQMEEFMRSHKLLTNPVSVDEAFDNSFLP